MNHICVALLARGWLVSDVWLAGALWLLTVPYSLSRCRNALKMFRPALRRNMGGGMWGRIMCLAGKSWKV
jgi:hypothetical protein